MTIESEVVMAEGEITPELIEAMNRKKGLKLHVKDIVFNEEATKTAIRKFADGIGDPNPLWLDEEYAKRTRYGRLVAPPSWVFSVLAGVQFGWRGLAGFHISTEIEFFKPVWLNDRITPESIYLGFDGPKESRFAKRVVIDSFQEKYFNQEDQVVAVAVRKVLRAERSKTRMMAIYENVNLPHPWTRNELELIEEEVLAQDIRGFQTRYWEDVEIGEKLSPLVKGPLTVMDIIAAMVAGLAPASIAAQAVALKEYRRRPAWAYRNHSTGALESLLAVHYDKQAARAMGLPYPYDIGTQRQAWHIHHMTNWMGDDGRLKSCYSEFRRFVFLSDVLRFSSRVVDKYIDTNGESCVEIETHTYNQRREDVMLGRAIIILPSRERGSHPIDSGLF